MTVMQKLGLTDSKTITNTLFRIKQKSQQMLKVSSIGSNTDMKPFATLVNRLIDNVMLDSGPHFNQALLQLYDIRYRLMVYALLHDTPNLVVNWIQVRNVCRPQVWGSKLRWLTTQQLWTMSRLRSAGTLSCYHGSNATACSPNLKQ